jgi:hypothetical protein
LGYVERLAMRKKRLRVCLSMVRGTMVKINIYIYIPSGRRQIVDQKTGTGETLEGLMHMGPARERVVLCVGA